MSSEQASAIEDYALIGDCTTAALVGHTGSIDWLCWPRFDSAACFGALLGDPDNGRWSIAPAAPAASVSRSYRDGSAVVETVFRTPDGDVALIDFMPMDQDRSSLVRIVEGRGGRVAMAMEVVLRFDYGSTVPWVTQLPEGGGFVAIAGPNMVTLRAGTPLQGRDMRTVAEFAVAAGERVSFTMTYQPSHLPRLPAIDADAALADTERHWSEWCAKGRFVGRHAELVKRSLITLKTLTYAPTGGIAAAATTSLPEQLGGSRNWDYRYCWLRDATLTLFAFMHCGLFEEAQAWRDWLQRSVAGSPDQIQIMYGLAGERRLDEWSVPWLAGYQGAAPVRVGNAAAGQLQLDVYGEVMDALHQARDGGLAFDADCWALEQALVEHLIEIWMEPDEGIWETRGGRQLFTFSRAMAWVAVDRAVKSAEQYGLEAPLERWRAVRDEMHATICERGFNKARNSFVQVFDGDTLDASLLMLALTGFLPATDPRILGTVAAIEAGLMAEGFVLRYDTSDSKDGLPPGEGAFLACSFWLAENYYMQGRHADANALFDRLVGLCNDVGLLAEEYDPRARRQVGNFPQAFSHVALVSCALMLGAEVGPAEMRVAA